MPGFLKMVQPVDLLGQGMQPVILGLFSIEDIDDLLKYHNFGKKEKILFTFFIFLNKGELLFRIGSIGVPRAKATEIDHMFIFLIEEMMEIGCHPITVLTVQSARQPFDQPALAMDIDAVKSNCLVEAQRFALGFIQFVPERCAFYGDEFRAGEPSIPIQFFRPFQTGKGIDVVFFRNPTQPLNGMVQCLGVNIVRFIHVGSTFSRSSACQLRP